MFYRTATLALVSSIGFGGAALAEIVEGTVSAVTSDGQLQIILPDGVRVADGDNVEVLAEIPGLGPVAIASQWKVTGTVAGIVTATPEEAPSGTPQVGYLVRIDTQDGGSTVLAPVPTPTDPVIDPNTGENQNLSEFVDAMNIYLAARDLSYSSKHPDLAGAADLYRRSADLGYDPAMTELGAVLSFGRGVNRDDRAALEWQDRAAGLGNADALHRLGLIYLTGRGVPVDEIAAADWFKKSAGQGNDNAMFLLAMLYEDGVGVPASMIEMVNWLEKAARHDNTNAMFVLGQIYLEGEDGVIAKDVYKTEDYWLAAAEAGHVASMEALAEFYEGEAINAAEKWANAARNTPRPPAYTEDLRCLSHWECYIPETAAVRVDPAPVPPVESERPDRSPRVIYVVQDCDRYAASPRDPDRPDLEMSVEYGDLDAQRVISECLDDINKWPDTRRFYAQIARGYFKSGMHDKAFEAAMISADLGSGQGMAVIGLMYKSGLSVRQDAFEALRWFEKAGHEGNVTAMHFAAGMHLHAEGVDYNPQAAANWFQAAADQNSTRAYTSLGILYDNGEGVPYDPARAAANLMIGLATGSSEAKELLLQSPNNLTGQTRIELQRILRSDGLYRGALDGNFGQQTLQALRARIMN